MTSQDILAAANVGGFSNRFRRWLSFILAWECDFDHDGQILSETLGDGAGTTFAGLTSRDDGLTDAPTALTALWVASTYRERYWIRSQAEMLPMPVGEVVANYAVNCGLGRASRFLQSSLIDYGARIELDGIIGANTVSAAWKVPTSKELALAVIAKSAAYYNSIALDGRQQWLMGWINRNKSLRDTFCA
jgi:lysozyme family protein